MEFRGDRWEPGANRKTSNIVSEEFKPKKKKKNAAN